MTLFVALAWLGRVLVDLEEGLFGVDEDVLADPLLSNR
jgi:hypothetical protein